MAILQVRYMYAALGLAALAAGTYWLLVGGDTPPDATAAGPSSTLARPSSPLPHEAAQELARSVGPPRQREAVRAPTAPSAVRGEDDSANASGAPIARVQGYALDYETAFVELPAQPTRWRYSDANDPVLQGQDFGGADLAFADLSGADLRGSDFELADLHFADLRDTNLEGATFNYTQLKSADLRGAMLRGATMVPPVNFRDADLRGVDLRGVEFPFEHIGPMETAISYFDNSRLDDADLRRVDFSQSMIFRAVFDGADLRGANLADTMGPPKSMRDALYDRYTQFPDGIDPEEWQMIYVPEGGGSE